MRFPLGGGINGLARGGGPGDLDVRLPDRPADPARAGRRRRRRAAGPRATGRGAARAPAGEVIGTLAISYRTPREIAADELDLLQGLADQAAIALTNSNLYELLGESEAATATSSRTRRTSSGRSAPTPGSRSSPTRASGSPAGSRKTSSASTSGRSSTRARARSRRSTGRAGLGEATASEDRELRGRVNLLHRDGHPIPAEFIAFATRDEAGGFAGANGIRPRHERARPPRARAARVRGALPVPDRELARHHLLDRSGRPVQLRLRRRPPVARRRAGGSRRDAVPRPDPVPRRRDPRRPVRAARPRTPSSS